LLSLAEVHFIEIGEIKSVPENIFGSEKRALVLAVAVSARNLFALLDVEGGINAVDFPSRWEFPDFGLLEFRAHAPFLF
jgi:hypothetical protein